MTSSYISGKSSRIKIKRLYETFSEGIGLVLCVVICMEAVVEKIIA